MRAICTVFLANLSPEDTKISSIHDIFILIDSVIRPHISGSIAGSYMTCDTSAPIEIDSIQFKNIESIKVQSLWKMKNDFMGGVYVAQIYYTTPPVLSYTYLYAPGEKKSVPLLQLEALTSTILK